MSLTSKIIKILELAGRPSRQRPRRKAGDKANETPTSDDEGGLPPEEIHTGQRPRWVDLLMRNLARKGGGSRPTKPKDLDPF